MSTSPASSQVLFSTVPIVTCSTHCTCMHAIRVRVIKFRAHRSKQSACQTHAQKLHVTKFRTVHCARGTKLMQLCYMYAPRATPCRSPRPPLRRREAPPQWWAGWAGLQVHGNMQVRNKIAGHVLGTWTGGCPKEQFFPIHTWHEHSPAHPQESTKLATS